LTELLLKDEVYAIIGAAIEVHRQLGTGFLEAVYQDALEIELASRGVPFESQKQFQIWYKGCQLSRFYLADLVCYDKIIVELKAIESLTSRDEAQLLNYLKASGLKVGVLINFSGFPKMEWKRLVL